MMGIRAFFLVVLCCLAAGADAAIGKQSVHGIIAGEYFRLICRTYNTHSADFQTWSHVSAECDFYWPVLIYEHGPWISSQIPILGTTQAGWIAEPAYSCPGWIDVWGNHQATLQNCSPGTCEVGFGSTNSHEYVNCGGGGGP